jgi:biopolymer transport protein ExbD
VSAKPSIVVVLVSALTLVAACDRAAPLDEEESSLTRVAANDADPPLYVLVSADGVTTIAGEPVLEDHVIATRASAYHQRFPRGRAVVRCAPAALHGRTVRVLDLLREAEIGVVSVLVVR